MNESPIFDHVLFFSALSFSFIVTLASITLKILSAAESENAILSLAKELEKTQRLINALEYVIMPNYQESMKLISAVLEEREREDFTRLKHVKKVLERKRLEE